MWLCEGVLLAFMGCPGKEAVKQVFQTGYVYHTLQARW